MIVVYLVGRSVTQLGFPLIFFPLLWIHLFYLEEGNFLEILYKSVF